MYIVCDSNYIEFLKKFNKRKPVNSEFSEGLDTDDSSIVPSQQIQVFSLKKAANDIADKLNEEGNGAFYIVATAKIKEFVEIEIL